MVRRKELAMSLEAMKKIFSDRAELQRWLDVEAALAKAEAAVGIIPKEAACEIGAKARVELISEAERQRVMERTGQPIVAMIHSLEAVCEGDAGGYIHWGATTQDITDTGDIMAIRDAYWVIFNSLRDIEGDLVDIAEREAETLMAGRTHGQHALPITFGFKVSEWIRETRRHVERLKECRKRLFVGQLSGAVGTFASIGEKGPEMRALTLNELGLANPDTRWYAARDRIAEFACIVAMIAATLGKIANEISVLQRTEVGEVVEFFVPGMVYSSTMPQKRNPRECEKILSLSQRIRYYAPMFIEGMIIEHERHHTGWDTQRDSLPGMCCLMGELLDRMKIVSKGLTIYRKRMEENVDLLKGLILSEAVMLELGKKIGRQKAHDVVSEAAVKAFDEGISLKETLMQDSRVTEHLSEPEIDRLLTPWNYIGLSVQITRDMVALTREEREKD
jgi:adenylosuccinate lyase